MPDWNYTSSCGSVKGITPFFLEVGHSLSHSLCENENKTVMVNAKCNHSVAGSGGVAMRGVSRNTRTVGPASRSFSTRK